MLFPWVGGGKSRRRAGEQQRFDERGEEEMNVRSAVVPYLQVHRQEVGHALQAQGRDVCYSVEPQVEHLAGEYGTVVT